MNKLEIVKAFLADPDIQQKYNLRPDELDRMTLNSPHPSPLVGLVLRMVELVEGDTSSATVSAQLNAYLETVLRS